MVQLLQAQVAACRHWIVHCLINPQLVWQLNEQAEQRHASGCINTCEQEARWGKSKECQNAPCSVCVRQESR